jgi:hypothetical protein
MIVTTPFLIPAFLMTSIACSWLERVELRRNDPRIRHFSRLCNPIDVSLLVGN